MDIITKAEKGQTVAIDFDGVIHKYSKGWHDGTIYDRYDKQVVKYIKLMMEKGVAMFILSTREPQQIKEWWDINIKDIKCEIIEDNTLFYNNTKVLGITNRKLPAVLYIDDRAYRYEAFSGLMAEELMYETLIPYDFYAD